MGLPVTRIVRRSVRAGQKMVSQIVVSVAAAVCVGLITNAYLETPSATAPTPDAATAQAAATEIAGEAPTAPVSDTPVRIVGGATNTSVRSGAPARPLQPVSVSSAPVRDVTDTPVRDVAEAPGPTVQQPAAVEVASLPPLASQTITDLPVADLSATQGAEIFPGVPAEGALADSLRAPAEQKPERRRFLGLPLPYFVPTANDLLHSASAAGGRIVALVDH